MTSPDSWPSWPDPSIVPSTSEGDPDKINENMDHTSTSDLSTEHHQHQGHQAQQEEDDQGWWWWIVVAIIVLLVVLLIVLIIWWYNGDPPTSVLNSLLDPKNSIDPK